MSLNPFGKARERLEYDFKSRARPNQMPPPGDWAIWLLLAGRRFGKTFAGSQWVRTNVESGLARRIALVAPTAADCRDIMVSAILENSPPSTRPLWEPSKRSLTWQNGAHALAFSAEEPERIRGYGFEIAWCDETCAWGRNLDATWDQLQFTLSRGRRPRVCISTTPKPSPFLRKLLLRDDIVITRGRTIDNSANLSKQFVESITARYAGTRLGRQELDAEILEDLPGAFWTPAMIDAARKPVQLPDMARVVVAVDASGARGADDEAADSIGIVIVGKGVDGRGYVLADRTCKLSPAAWGRRAVDAYHEFKADRIVAERNFGGAMIEHVIRSVDPGVSYKEVSASRGKAQRAEPVASLYEQGRVSHIGDLSLLEDQLSQFSAEGYAGKGSPDAADALIWGLTEVLVNQNLTTGFLDFYAAEAARVGTPIAAGPGGPSLERLVRLVPPPGIGGVRLLSGRDATLWPGDILECTADDAKPLINAGWQRAASNAPP
jgi:phage terminase large subunit-like protein